MRYIVALRFDYFDGDFRFDSPDGTPLLHDMRDDALSEGYVRLFDEYGEAASFAHEVVARICDRADTDGDPWKEEFIGRIRDGLLHDIDAVTAAGCPVTFDYSEDYGNWGIRIRLLREADGNGTWEYPEFM